MNIYKFKIIFILWIALSSYGLGQEGVFFKDSNSPGYYDSGLAFFSPPSIIKQSQGDKIPTSTAYKSEGNNSLELTWNSATGGDWNALIIAPDFSFQDISLKDTLILNVYTLEELAVEDLPYLYFEAAPGFSKSSKYDLAQFISSDIPIEEWITINIPLSVYFDDAENNNINFDKTKAVILGQKNADNVQHTLFIDCVIATLGNISDLPINPDNVIAIGYERHVELTWNSLLEESSINTIEIYRSQDQGITYDKIGETRDSIYIDFTGEDHRNSILSYKLRSRKPTGIVSEYTEAIQVSTMDMTDDQLLNMVQKYTFRYFWDFAHPQSGMAYERNTSVANDVVTSGGSGFGIMAIPVGIERGFISRQQGVDRILKILIFLENAERFHGAYSHWINGSTGKVIPFFREDNGGDLVETSFLIQGLLTVLEYFDHDNLQERTIREKIKILWETVEWSWYQQRTNDNQLTWHWSPDYNWTVNHSLHGWNEVLITYFLAIASPTYGISTSLYDTGWARNGAIKSGESKYGITLPLGNNNGGPLFFTHYSFLGLNPKSFGDKYISNYFDQGQAQTLINKAYCIDNPGNYNGYNENCWGLTASDDPDGYAAHEPSLSGDNGTISPTAALSSMPYTPEESINAFKHLYREHGAKIWGKMGFYDAFNLSRDWFAKSYLAIDQGPIILMIENYRSELLWNNFMKNDDIQNGVRALADLSTAVDDFKLESTVEVFPNPTNNQSIKVKMPTYSKLLFLYSIDGRQIEFETNDLHSDNDYKIIEIDCHRQTGGTYFIGVLFNGQLISKKVILR